MSDIEIYSPCNLSFSVLEIDNNLPSFKTEVIFSYQHPTGVSNYTASDVWFWYEQWDDFTNGLYIILEWLSDQLYLYDISENFIIHVCYQSKRDVYIVTISMSEPNIGEGEVTIKFSTILSRDTLFVWHKSRLNFPKRW